MKMRPSLLMVMSWAGRGRVRAETTSGLVAAVETVGFAATSRSTGVWPGSARHTLTAAIPATVVAMLNAWRSWRGNGLSAPRLGADGIRTLLSVGYRDQVAIRC